MINKTNVLILVNPVGYHVNCRYRYDISQLNVIVGSCCTLVVDGSYILKERIKMKMFYMIFL